MPSIRMSDNDIPVRRSKEPPELPADRQKLIFAPTNQLRGSDGP